MIALPKNVLLHLLDELMSNTTNVFPKSGVEHCNVIVLTERSTVTSRFEEMYASTIYSVSELTVKLLRVVTWSN